MCSFRLGVSSGPVDISTKPPKRGEMALRLCFILNGEVSSLRRLRATPRPPAGCCMEVLCQDPADRSPDRLPGSTPALSAPSFWPVGTWKAACRSSHMEASQTQSLQKPSKAGKAPLLKVLEAAKGVRAHKAFSQALRLSTFLPDPPLQLLGSFPLSPPLPSRLHSSPYSLLQISAFLL